MVGIKNDGWSQKSSRCSRLAATSAAATTGEASAANNIISQYSASSHAFGVIRSTRESVGTKREGSSRDSRRDGCK